MRLTLAFILAPTLAMATPYDGIYRQNANAECALVGVDGGSLKIEDGVFYGVDMECRMARPVQVVNMDATLYDMNCVGEDDVWTERAMVMNDGEVENGIIMIWDGYAFRYSRCDPVPAPEPVDYEAAPEEDAEADEADADAETAEDADADSESDGNSDDE
ncbi:hypothetical protein [Thalassorhabdomicrobium marinisediminis]|uniref:hypothetical protein n=1 Tax=Thalassorhabdomicrobium marinisediminis TaxID=2170577 RepID=UPI0024935350|nr:hypothetical protein [Thalassorhabdomicrobium marinisediminis]